LHHSDARRHDHDGRAVEIHEFLGWRAALHFPETVLHYAHGPGRTVYAVNRADHARTDHAGSDSGEVRSRLALEIRRTGNELSRIEGGVNQKVGQRSRRKVNDAGDVDRPTGVGQHTQTRKDRDAVPNVRLRKSKVDRAYVDVAKAAIRKTTTWW